MSEKIKITINGKEILATPGKTILQVAEENGIDIPHYCYHPGLPVAGNCRMCLVEVEGARKLQTACSTKISDGMVVRTNTPEVRETVRQVLEFLLINHPLDCPVCDQAGECGLQDYYMEYGQYDTKFIENKNKKTKKATPIGKYVMLDQERCILCARCVRFTRFITKTEELGIFNRGDHSEVDVYPGKELNNRYTGNLVDICPVGALTCRDFRFQCRVWYLEEFDSICPGCSRGCNIKIYYNPHRPHKAEGKRVLRFKPRPNLKINRFWMCDDGRYGYKFIDENRIMYPLLMENGEQKEIYYGDAIKKFGEFLKESIPDRVIYLLSANSTNEELFATKKFFVENYKLENIFLPDEDIFTGDKDDLLITEDKHPNTNGVKAVFNILYKDLIKLEELNEMMEKKSISLLVVNRHELPEEVLSYIKENNVKLIFIGTNFNKTAKMADLVIPISVFAEKEGSFVNVDKLFQMFTSRLEPLGTSVPEWVLFNNLSEIFEYPVYFASYKAILKHMVSEIESFKKIDINNLDKSGEMVEL